jgi:hypothetical protein
MTFYNEIIPLLEEYFYSEEDKIRKILWSDFFEKKTNKNLFNDEETEEKFILKNLENTEFKNALIKIYS